MTFKHQHSTTMQLQNQQQMSTEWEMQNQEYFIQMRRFN